MAKLLYQRGFTLIELLITITILAVVSMIAIGSYTNYIETTKISSATSQIKSLALIIDDYKLENGHYPENLNEIGNAELLDPWGNQYVFYNFQGGNSGKARKDHNLVPINTYYDLYSHGKDGKSSAPLTAQASQDDIIYANDGAYVGLAKLF